MTLKDEIKNPSEHIDIGNGFKLHREFLTTMKATCGGKANEFGRSLLKKLFEPSELVGYSLMGKGCNANKSEKLPGIDPRRRDAVIGND